MSLMVVKQQANPLIARLLLTDVADVRMVSESDFVACHSRSSCFYTKNSFASKENKIDFFVLPTDDKDKARVMASFFCDQGLFGISYFPFSRVPRILSFQLGAS